MNTFNNVFLSVKKYCNAEPSGRSDDKDCFNHIAYQAEIAFDKLEFYLKTLQDLGVIKYSWRNKTIHLTAFGKKLEKIST